MSKTRRIVSGERARVSTTFRRDMSYSIDPLPSTNGTFHFTPLRSSRFSPMRIRAVAAVKRPPASISRPRMSTVFGVRQAPGASSVPSRSLIYRVFSVIVPILISQEEYPARRRGSGIKNQKYGDP